MMVIDEASLEDSEALSTLLGLLFSQEAEFCVDALKQKRGLEMILSHPEIGRIFVLRDEGNIVGMVSLLFSVSTALGEKVAWLEDMIIAPAYRHKGYGKMLLDHTISQAKHFTCKRITLLRDHDNDDAKVLYERLGFSDSTMVAMRLAIL